MSTRLAALLCLVWFLWGKSITQAQVAADSAYRPDGSEDYHGPLRQAIVSEPTTAERQSHELSRQPSNVPYLRLLPTSVPPVVDGVLDDFCWQNAPVISEFTQVEPTEGAAPTERTEVRIRYDQDHLYIAVRCYDTEPGKIVATQMQRDADLESDDTITLTFDTFARKRAGYLFRMNPANARQDALIGENGDLNVEWDTIWSGRSRIDSEGWTAEFAIPFKSLSFDPKSAVWGFNVERQIRRKQETVRWACPFKSKSISSLADFGQLQNLSGLRQGLGLEVKPFLAARYRSGDSDRGFDLKPGLDVFYRITPTLTAALTVNTDFAEAEADIRQINLTRFPLFFPEKRDFFLQDATLFNFNDSNGPLPFYSRRIGLSPAGEPVDILVGAKLTGRIGDLDVGFMDMQMDDATHVAATNLSVARLAYRLLDESSIGGIFTYGDPAGHHDNWLGGFDLNFRNSHVFENNLLAAQAWFLSSGGDGGNSGQAFGGTLRYPNDPLWAEVYASQVDRDFDPGLGFVARTDVREYGGYFRYRWRPGGYLRYVDLELAPQVFTGMNSVVETELWTAPGLRLVNQRGDELYLGFTSERENLFEPFEIQPGHVIQPGDYRFNRGFASISTTTARPLSAFASVDAGEFYNGSSEKYGGGLEWRASSHLYFSVQSELDDVSLPDGGFDVVLTSARVNLTFNPNLSWNTLIQYDNVSDTVGIYSRIRWTVRPGSDVYLVFKHGLDTEDVRFAKTTNEVAAKLGWTFRF